MRTGARLRQVANLLNASTLLGLLLAAGARCTVRPGPRGLVLATGYRWRLPFAAAFTVGNVVLFRAGTEHVFGDRTEGFPDPAYRELLGHEERHSTQYAWCLGMPFLPLYFVAAGWSWWRTGNPGTANPFERRAGLRAGGYPPSPARSPGRSPGRSPLSRRRRTSGTGSPGSPAIPVRSGT